MSNPSGAFGKGRFGAKLYGYGYGAATLLVSASLTAIGGTRVNLWDGAASLSATATFAANADGVIREGSATFSVSGVVVARGDLLWETDTGAGSIVWYDPRAAA